MYSTFLGGGSHPNLGGTEDVGYDIAVDTAGNAYVTGWTQSTNFPTTPGAFQTNFGGGQGDAFVTKLNPTGSNLVYSSYLGGDSLLNGAIGDASYGIVIDSSGNAYVTGLTISDNFPTTSGAFITAGYGAFVTKMNSAGSGLIYSSLFCACNSWGYSIAVDFSNNVYITGWDESTNFPTTAGAFQARHGGSLRDAFVVKMDAAGSAPIYSTYLGGSNDDWGYGIAVDGIGNAYITGLTQSTNFPITSAAYQVAFNGFQDPYLVKLDPTGSALVYSTFLGWTDSNTGWMDFNSSIAMDNIGNIYLASTTSSSDFPTTAGAFQMIHGGGRDVFLAKLAVDSDGDGFPDNIEEKGYDFNGEHVDLPGMGANKNRKDIFIYIDWIEGEASVHKHKPAPESINPVVEAFNNAPVDCDDSGRNCKGINLHVVFGQKIVETAENEELGYVIGDWEYDWNEFNSYKRSNFPRKLWPIFHYVIFGHHLPRFPGLKNNRAAGISKNKNEDFKAGASDFIVALGTYEEYPDLSTIGINLTTARAGNMMHELGHNLGLGHGGVILDTNNGKVVASEPTNFKPNHLSVMNYSFSSRGLMKKDNNGVFQEGYLDYSRFEPDVLPDLNENLLTEPNGIGAANNVKDYGTRYYCQATHEAKVLYGLQQAVDWNCDNDRTDISLVTNINKDEDSVGNQILSTLRTVNEWSHLRYKGGEIGAFGMTIELPTVTSMDISPEITLEDDVKIGPFSEPPIADAGGPYIGVIGESITFDGSGSADPDGTITLYEWDFDNDGTFDIGSPNPITTHAYPAAFSGTITLRVTDSDGNTGTDTAQVQVEDVGANLTVVKAVVNDHGGAKTVSDFLLLVDDTPVTSGVATTVAPGTHTVSEQNLPGYTAIFSGDCNASGQVTVNAGESKTCIITNDDQPGSITIIKDAVPDDPQDFAFSGTPGNFILDDDPSNNTLSNQATFANLASGSYTVNETTVNGWAVTAITCNDSDSSGNPALRSATINLALGESVTCTFTNQRKTGTLVGTCSGYTVYQNGSVYSAPGWSGSIKVGTSASNTINGSNGADLILGLGGNDKLYGKGGDDVICGGDGNDLIEGATGNDNLEGANGNDLLRGQSGDYDILLGGDGNDGLFDPDGVDGIHGGAGLDLLTFALRKGWRDRTGATRFNQKLSGGYQDDVVLFAILDPSTFFINITGDERDDPPAAAEGHNDSLALAAKLDPASVIIKFEHPLVKAADTDAVDQVTAMEQQYANEYGFILNESQEEDAEQDSTQDNHLFLPIVVQ